MRAELLRQNPIPASQHAAVSDRPKPETETYMYVYDEYDQRIIEDRVKQFRDQTRRYLAGELSEEEFRPLRLQNGLYIQRFAPMLRVAVPYGQLTSRQVRKLAKIARDYDKGYAHISTRQNVQYNWPALEDVPEILAELATVQMHAIQTSGNCLRNVTTDQFAGVAADELIDPRPVVRDCPPVDDFPPGIRLSAAQVQDRHQRLDLGPCGHRSPRHRPGNGLQRGRRAGLPCPGRRWPWGVRRWSARSSTSSCRGRTC